MHHACTCVHTPLLKLYGTRLWGDIGVKQENKSKLQHLFEGGIYNHNRSMYCSHHSRVDIMKVVTFNLIKQ